jgi:4-hydroxy-tetrahydrodipicolinate reductase
MIKVAMLGMGRMGHEIVGLISQERDIKLVAAIDKRGAPVIGKETYGIPITSSDKLSETLYKSDPDIVVDFTNAGACLENSKIICENEVNLVIGTTGFSEGQMNKLKAKIEKNKIGAVISPNFSIGVNVFWELIREAVKSLPDCDIEIIEKHHRFKKDSPSGTAKRAAEIIAGELGRNFEDIAIYGRKGRHERKEGEIGIHAIRAGDIVGEHLVLFGTLGERIEIAHRASSREAFARGVIRAIKFIAGKKGIYGMGDVLGL